MGLVYGNCTYSTIRSYRFLESVMNNLSPMAEPIRDVANRTPSEVIPMGGRFEVHHYKKISQNKFKTPLLFVGSLINRHYILDLMPRLV